MLFSFVVYPLYVYINVSKQNGIIDDTLIIKLFLQTFTIDK